MEVNIVKDDMTTEEMLVKLPCLWADITPAPYGTEYTPNLYPYDGEWHLSWINSEEGDSLIDFQGKTIHEAVSKAFKYITTLGFLIGEVNFE